MGTRAAAFTAKIKNLNEIQLRLMQNSVPLPQGHEIANSLKYFSTTLLGVLKDVPGQPLVMIRYYYIESLMAFTYFKFHKSQHNVFSFYQVTRK